MNIEKTAKEVVKIFTAIDKASHTFVENSGLKCPTGCYHCCTGKDITASPLEYLPYSIGLLGNGTLEDRYWAFKESQSEHCFLLKKEEGQSAGMCSEYAFRGITCRLFGNAAMIDKFGGKKFVGCKILKEQSISLPLFNENMQAYSPVFAHNYMALKAIDIQYGSLLMPIKEAILCSMEIVFNNSQHKRHNKAASLI
jgi:uncharacterized protein